MKKNLLFILILLFSTSVYSQEELFKNNKPDEAVKLDARSSQMDFVPNQVLVKFRDELNAVLGKSAGGPAFLGVASVDEIFAKYKVTSAERLFPNEKRKFQKRVFKTASGKLIEEQSLHNIYKLQFAEAQNIYNLMEELKQNPNVEYAEPNYILSIVDDKAVSPELTEKEMLEWVKGHYVNRVHDQEQEQDFGELSRAEQEHETFTPPNDPLYPQQWYIDAVQADSVWKQTTGDTTQVIAILDTGVDWLHPDLKNKIWINKAEIPDNGNDDDHDGYVDDVRGWDWINNDNNPTDDNSHGTHVAGIAAAEANNGIGIAGVNWKAKIMALKVFQSSGRGDAATITQGINYAATHGATVINMSFGSYARSLTMEAALANAYATCVLVAAAGNDNYYIGPKLDCMYRPPHPFYPAALSYVLGIQSDGNCGVGFSNYDDSPTYSEYPDLLNYELNAPGSGILSTVPNGNYREYSGTSMAAPIVSGAVSLYKKFYPTDSQELMWGNLINTANAYLNILHAVNITPNPKLSFITCTIIDTLDGDKDGRVDAGETIELWFTVRNTWGHSDSVFVGIRFGEFEDQTVAQIIKSAVFVGSISPYAKRSNELNPLKIKISPGVSNDRDIVFEGLMWYKGSTDTVKQRILLTVENGTQLSGVMDSTLVLTPNRLWLVNESFRVGSKGIINIRPGTQLILSQNIVNKGRIVGEGKKDSLIIVKGPGSIIDDSFNGTVEFRYASFNGLKSYFSGKTLSFSNCLFTDLFTIGTKWGGAIFGVGNTIMENNVIVNSSFGRLFSWGMNKPVNFKKNTVTNCLIYTGGMLVNTLFDDFVPLEYNNFINIKNYRYQTFGDNSAPSPLFSYTVQPPGKNNFMSIGKYTYFAQASGSADVINIPNQYWGTINLEKIKVLNFDFWDNPSFPMFHYQPILTSPADSAHGIVWKVLVNGKDAQDEVVDPLGVATHRFDVYFNREMDRNYPPQISFGVREPYTQQSVALNGSWSSDSKIYTAYKKVELYTGDGINRVRVSGAKDLEGFEIPIEDMRFEFLIDAAGSASTDFLATAGIGKVKLEWPIPQDLPTLLGYNIYRFTNLTDTTFTETAQINDQLVTDTTYIDFKVEPHKKYYYKYKVVRTDFTESDFSKVVNATVLTASRGDANGSMTVDVMDIVSIVGYILGQNPQPFIFEAGDVNADNTINILDVVGVVNIILGRSPNPSVNKVGSVVAKLELKNDKLELQSDVAVSGIQFTLRGKNLDKLQFSSSNEIRRFELASGGKGDTVKTFIIYSLSNNILKQGSYTLGSFAELDNSAHLDNVIVSDESGKGILTNVVDKGVPSIPTEYYLSQNYPNPFNGSTIIQYGLPKKGDVRIVIYNILGQRVRTLNEGERNAGRYQVIWDGKDDREGVVSSGVYIYRIETAEYMKAKKLVYMK